MTLGANLGLLGLTQASCSREMTQQDAEEPLATEPAVDIGNRQGQGGDVLVPLTAKQVKVGGEIGRRFILTIEKNLLALNDDYWLTSFRKKSEKPSHYVGIGKLIEAAARFAAHCPDPQVAAQAIAFKDHLVRELIETQLPDGYIGSMREPNRMNGEYDVHEHGYIILGFVTNHMYFGDDASLEGARKAADYVIKHWPGTKLTTLGVPQAFAALSEATGNRRYSDFAETNPMGRDSSVPLRKWAIYPGKAPTYAQNHCYRWLARCLMQLELYRREPDASLLKQARDLENYLLKEDGLLIHGTVGRGEVWHNDQDGRGRPVGDDVPLHYRGGDVAETCATAYLIRVLERLTRLTGEQRHADVMERAIYNGLFAAQSPSGRRLRYFTALEGPRVYFPPDSYCCPNNFRRIVAELPGMIYYRTRDGLAINLYTASTATVPFEKADGLTVRQETDYPNSGKVTLLIGLDRSREFAVHLRIPRWCRQAVVRVNKEAPKQARGGTSVVLKRQWHDGDRVSLEMPMSWRWVKGRKRQAGRMALMRGPLVFCLSAKRNDGGTEWIRYRQIAAVDISSIVVDSTSVVGPIPDESVRPGGIACRVKAWSSDRDVTKPPNLDLVLSEFPEPTGEATYFLVSDATVAVDDELIIRD